MTNVLLVILDGVRAQNTSIHGYHNETTPFLSSFVERATIYEQARSPGVESLSSHTSILTGYHIPEHGITSSDCHLSDGELIWEQLQDKGYKTGVFTENPFLTKGTLAKDTAYDTVIDWREEYPYPDSVDPKTFIKDGQQKN
jgi:arylsulfatase A-like enzyme